MSEEVLVTNIQKEKGMLYFVRPNAEGFLVINKSKAGRIPKDKVEDAAQG